MTDEEMAYEYAMYDDNGRVSVNDDKFKGFLDGLKAGRPKWHDAEENPIEDKQYLCKVKSVIGGLVYYRCLTWNTEYHEWKSDNGGLVPDDIIIWSEIKE